MQPPASVLQSFSSSLPSLVIFSHTHAECIVNPSWRPVQPTRHVLLLDQTRHARTWRQPNTNSLPSATAQAGRCRRGRHGKISSSRHNAATVRPHPVRSTRPIRYTSSARDLAADPPNRYASRPRGCLATEVASPGGGWPQQVAIMVAMPRRWNVFRRIQRKHARIIGNALVVVAVVIALKAAAHALGWEALSLNPLLSGIVAADVFLMGFLLSGVLADFKESEKLPGEVAASLEILFDEATSMARRANDATSTSAAAAVTAGVRDLATSLHNWFYKKQRTSELMNALGDLSPRLLALESPAQAASIARIKQEQHALRRAVVRIHTIRETSFISSGYLIAELTTGLLSLALILSKIEPFYESLFIVGVIVFLLAFLLLLIGDLDNPFGYYEKHSSEEVSLKPLEDAIARIGAGPEK